MPQRYSKTHDELAYLLVSRGIGSASGLSDDELRKTISERLAAVNYYRLSAYWYQFRSPLAFQPTKRACSRMGESKAKSVGQTYINIIFQNASNVSEAKCHVKE